jgi:alpha/beta superfamily hydrolase
MSRQEPVTFLTREGDVRLEGVLHLPDAPGPLPALAVCHPHPQMGGDMENNVVGAICRAALAQNIAALRFNFRGVGGSSGEYSGGVGERDDAWAALDHLRGRGEIDPSRLGLAGYSFGAAVALNCAAAAGVRALVAVSAPPRMLDFTAQMGFEFPLLLIAGDSDAYVPAERLQQLAVALGPRAIVTIVPGVDHFWWGAERQLEQAVGAFFSEHLNPAS